jgi:preprotein translocase subunit Sec61beta
MTTDNFTAPRKDRSHRIAPRYVTWSAIAVPIMVLTGWAFLAAVPLALLLWGTWTDRRIKALRWWSGLTALFYAIPLVQYLTRADPEASMSSLLHPAMGIAIALSTLVVVLKILKSHRG